MSVELKMIFSVIIPAYNVEKYLAEALDSVLQQDFSDFEVVVVNDCSTDSTLDICEHYSKRDSRVLAISNEENKGVSVARNVGLSYAKGDVILFLDGDDILKPGALSTLYRCFSEDIDVVHFNADVFGDCEDIEEAFRYNYFRRLNRDGQLDLYRYLIREDKYRCPVWLYALRRRFIEENNLAFLEGVIHEDQAFTLQVMACAQNSQILIDDVLVGHRIHGSSIMSTKKAIDSAYGYFCVFLFLASWFKREENRFRLDRQSVRNHLRIFFKEALICFSAEGIRYKYFWRYFRHIKDIYSILGLKLTLAWFLPSKVLKKI